MFKYFIGFVSNDGYHQTSIYQKELHMQTKEIVAKLPELEGTFIEELLKTMESDIDIAFLSEIPPFDKETDLEEIGQLNKFEIALRCLMN